MSSSVKCCALLEGVAEEKFPASLPPEGFGSGPPTARLAAPRRSASARKARGSFSRCSVSSAMRERCRWRSGLATAAGRSGAALWASAEEEEDDEDAAVDARSASSRQASHKFCRASRTREKHVEAAGSSKNARAWSSPCSPSSAAKPARRRSSRAKGWRPTAAATLAFDKRRRRTLALEGSATMRSKMLSSVRAQVASSSSLSASMFASCVSNASSKRPSPSPAAPGAAAVAESAVPASKRRRA
mmetsp:Transcript_156028/g.500371  ORF Transcript_156028/g.500371 Transcript_156028/m.500371 type:complete len:245 (+) Transcript_156028:492-1226(+)